MCTLDRWAAAGHQGCVDHDGWSGHPGATVRAHNQGLVLDLIWRAPGVSRAELARRTGLSRSTLSALVSGLRDRGLVHESRGMVASGRPPIALEIPAHAFHLIGVELGWSGLRVLRTDLRGREVGRREVAHPVAQDPAGTLVHLVAALDELDDPTPLVGTGVAVPCPVDPAHPDALHPRILPAWVGQPLVRTLTEHTQRPVWVENDANALALAEQRFGAGDCPTFATLLLSAGVGAGLVMDGRLLRGTGGVAGEIGHTLIERGGPLCRCGARGCLDAVAGTQVLLAEHRARTGDADAPLEALWTGADVQALERAGRALGDAVSDLVCLFSPARVVLGGPLSQAGEVLLAPIRRTVSERTLAGSLQQTQVLVSPLGPDGVALGAATRVLTDALSHPDTFPLPA
jgi:predicted NBD/HSP70 family sugar kinase